MPEMRCDFFMIISFFYNGFSRFEMSLI